MRHAASNGYHCKADDKERDHFWTHTKTMAAGAHKQEVNCEEFLTYGNKPGLTGPECYSTGIPGIPHYDEPVSQRNFYKTVYRMVDPMTSLFPMYRKGTIAICLLALLALMLFASGCTQPASQQQTKTPAPVTATQTDNSHITIAYPGSTDMTMLLELEATVTDSTGKTQTKSIGDRQSTTPLKFGATLPLTGAFDGNDHVLVTGYFLDGSQKLVLDTTI
jgi:hypothetical protein